jgi:hypothetical protein
MADTASSILLLRLQGTGDNINLWGGYLNTALETLERGQRGYEAVTVNGDSTVSWTNYSASNSYAVGLAKLNAGSLTASFTTTLPNYAMKTAVWNNTGHNAGVKTSGGTPITIPHNYYAHVWNDGSNVISPNMFVNGTVYATEGSLGNNLATRDGVSALIASASIPGAAGTVKMDAAAASLYLNSAILVSGDLSKTDNGDTMTLSVSTTLDEGNIVFLSQVFG